MLDILIREGFICHYEIRWTTSKLYIALKYSGLSGQPAIKEIKSISTSGKKIYKSAHEIRPFMKGLGIYVVRTDIGIISSNDCWKFNKGGQILFSVY